MRLSWMLPGVLALGVSTCGPDSDGGDDGDDHDGGSANGGTGEGGTTGGDGGSAGRGGSSAGADGEAGAAGEDGVTGGTSGRGGASGMGGSSGDGGSSGAAGSGGCETGTADVLILLDRSASMRDPPEDVATTLPKWDLAVPPLVEALGTTTAPIRWGLKTFPEGETEEACAAGSVTSRIDVPIADDNAEVVRQAILAVSPDGASTPTGDALLRAAEHLVALPSQNPKFILLVTDGEPSCVNVTETSAGSENQEVARAYAVQALADTLDDGIATFVLGIGTNKETARSTLNAMAVAGGRPAPEVNPLETLFHLSNDADGATDALESILESASSCGPPPPAALPLPYSDDFESRNAADWRYFSAGRWSVVDDGGDNVLQLGTTGDSYDTWAIGGDRNWTNVRVQMRVKFVTEGGMLFVSPRFMDLDNHVFVEYEPTDSPKLRRRSQGSLTDLITSTTTLGFAVGQWHTVAVTLQGTTATLEIDGNVIGTAFDQTPVPKGGIGIAAENCIVALDDVRVTAP
jgi:hypothetical protein